MDFRSEFIGSGLFEGGEIIVRNPRFARDPEYRDGQEPALFVDLWLVEEQEEKENQRWGIGRGWVEEDEGTRVVRADGGKPVLNENTAVAKFVNTLLDHDAAVSWLEEKWKSGEEIRPTDTAFYDGLHVTIKGQSRQFKPNDWKEGDELGTMRWFDVTEYHGREGESGGASGGGTTTSTGKAAPAAGAAKKAPAAKKAAPTPAKKAVAKKAAAAAPAPEPVEETEEWTPDPEVMAMIRAVADASADADEFTATCYAEIPEVAADERYEAIANDVTSDESVWVIACAEYEAANG